MAPFLLPAYPHYTFKINTHRLLFVPTSNTSHLDAINSLVYRSIARMVRA